MSDACRIPSGDERRLIEILSDARQDMLQQLDQILALTHDRVTGEAAEKIAGDIRIPAPDDFRAVAFQYLFCRLCGADPESLKGGNTQLAEGLLGNLRNVMGVWSAASGKADG